jgi:F-type H+/Na+-transporting ATPase subunit alpha
VRRYEEEVYTFVETRSPGLLKAIAEKKQLDDALKAEISGALKEFGQTFAAARAA